VRGVLDVAVAVRRDVDAEGRLRRLGRVRAADGEEGDEREAVQRWTSH
jgi:hypothetical protein